MAHDILARNNVQELGHGARPMLFAHGFGCDQTIWQFVAPAFAGDYRVILFDYVGAGKSDRQAFDHQRYASLHGYVQDVLDICAALDLRDLIFVGHSISGMIGLLASLQAPERFARMIMLGSSACYLNDPPDYTGGFERADVAGLLDLMEKNYQGWASFLAPAVMQNAERPELARGLEASFLAADPAIARHFAAATFYADNRADLAFAKVPALLLQTEDDMIVPQAAAEYLRSHLPGSRLHMLRARGHYPHVSAPAELIQEIRAELSFPPPIA